MKKLISLSALVVVAACAAPSGQGAVHVSRTDNSALRTMSWTAMQCVYTVARTSKAGNLSQADVRAAIPSCEREISTYIDLVGKRRMRDGGFSSLHPTVLPELRRRYEARLSTEIARYY